MDDYQRYTMNEPSGKYGGGGSGCGCFIWIIVIVIVAELLKAAG